MAEKQSCRKVVVKLGEGRVTTKLESVERISEVLNKNIRIEGKDVDGNKVRIMVWRTKNRRKNPLFDKVKEMLGKPTSEVVDQRNFMVFNSYNPNKLKGQWISTKKNEDFWVSPLDKPEYHTDNPRFLDSKPMCKRTKMRK